ncbi:flagellar basal-body MS-ring/collar protein FliF [Ferrimonas sp. YFM]|uniref:flagellar basal-body MS-ring/collar protein FliF n=1 Tax=Ferrimonas sp. YFM TaxID=3028878 RepID=UPI0025734DF3|nr:flagellar basal-body MS-ring/collar protein FliF [Ferrimonas sp. YFM]BDY04027.1 flagellar M-ring protein [Ferrimonas sp. YFM]
MAEANQSTQLALGGNDAPLPAIGGEGSGAVEENKASPLGALGNSDTLRQVSLILALTVFLLMAVFIFLWAQEPEYRPLGKMDTGELVQTLDFLDQQKIDYQVEGNVISVPEEMYADIRLQMTRAGLQGKSNTEEDFLNQESGFGVSQRLESARLKHTQEQTLARAIEELRSVNRARVILALPKTNVFARQQAQPSATVVVGLTRNTELRQTEVDAIVDIVASAVHNLSPSRVTVTDQHGRLLNSGSQDAISSRARRELEVESQQEQAMLKKIDSILIPVLGLGNYTAQVDVTMDFSAVEETSKRFNPDLPSLRSEMVVTDNQNGQGSMGIPGALTNQPPMESAIPQEAGAGTNETLVQGNRRNRSEATRNYELDSTISHVRQQVGVVSRVTVSLAVDYALVPGAEGEPARPQPRSAEELASLKRLLEGSIGFNNQRGDLVEVISIPFAEGISLEEPELPMWEQPWFWRSLKMGGGLIIIVVLLLVVVRPLINRLLNPDGDKTKALEPGEELAEIEDQYAADTLGVLAQTEGDYSYAEDGSILLPDLHKDDDMLRAIRALVANEPELSTQVVKHWLEEDA